MYSTQAINTFKEGLVIKSQLLGQTMHFKTRYGVFSPKSIDDGTKLLLDYLDYNADDICLDLGCGYGAIGLSLAKVCPNGFVHLVDKDFISVDLSQENIKLNQINNAKVQLSDGLQNLPKNLKFNHIISNMPAKVGKEQMAIFLHDAYAHLHLGGQMTIVTINGLRDYIKRHFKAVFGYYDKVKQGKHYTISRCFKE